MKNKISRRKSIGLLSALPATGLLTSCATASKAKAAAPTVETLTKIAYDLKDPKDQLVIFEKLRGDMSGVKTYSYSEGRVFGIRPDQPEELDMFGKEVFRFSGCGMKIMRPVGDDKVETKSRSWLLYQDPETGEFLSAMKNPYTGSVVEVPPFRGGISGSIMSFY